MTTVSYTFQACDIDGAFDIWRVILSPSGAESQRVGAVRPHDDAIVLTERLNLAAISAGLHPEVQKR